MTLDEYYESIQGDLPGVRGRLANDDRIIKFIGLFLQDPTFDTLEQAMSSQNYEEAFRAAHTMKGLCGNLGFDGLGNVSSDLTEALRPDDAGQPKDIAQATVLFESVKDAYGTVVEGAKIVCA